MRSNAVTFVRPAARETWLILGSRYALTYPVFALYAIPVTLSTVLLAQTAPGQTSWLQWLTLGFIAWAAPVAVLLLIRVTLLRNEPRKSRPWLTLAAFVVAGVVRAVLFNVVEDALGVPDRETPWLRLTGGTFTIAITFALIAILIAARFEYRDQIRRLEADRLRLQELEVGLSAQVSVQRAQTLSTTQDVLEPIFEELKSSISQIHDPETANAVAARIKETVDAVVRPLSVEIASRPFIEISQNVGAPSRRHPRIRPEQRLSLGYFVLPFTYSAFIVSMTAASVLFVAGWAEGVRTLEVMFILMMAWLWLVRLVTLRIRLSPVLGGVVFTLIHVGVGLLITNFVKFLGTSIPDELLNGWLVLVGSVAILSYRYQLVDHARRLAVRSLAEVNDQLTILLSSLRQQLRVDARRIASTLHGPVQTALYASAMRLGRGEELSPKTVTAVLHDLDEAMKRLAEEPQEAPSPEEFVQEIRQVWGSKYDIDLEIDDRAKSTLGVSPVARSCVIEVIREGVNNAIKHGDATRVHIDIFLVEESLVDVTVTNQTSGKAPPAVPGFGSDVLTGLTHDWSLTTRDGETVLWASIAVEK